LTKGEINLSTTEFPRILNRPLDPVWSLGAGAQYTVLKFFSQLLKQRAVVLKNEDVEGVHQIRVAARRTRTALQTLTDIWDEGMARRSARYLAKFADAFGPARDLDVMIIYLEEKLAGQADDRTAAFKWLLERNRAERQKQQPLLVKAIQRFERDGFARDFVGYFSTTPVDLWLLGGPDG